MRPDQWLHLAGCLAVAALVSYYYAPGAGTGAAMIIGYARERLGNKDWSDMDANVAGCLLGEMLAAVLGRGL